MRSKIAPTALPLRSFGKPSEARREKPLVPLKRQNVLHLCPQGELLTTHYPCSLKQATAFPLTLLLCGLRWNPEASSSSSWADKPQASHFLCASVFFLAEGIIKLPSTWECCSFNSLISIRSLEILSHKGLWKCQQKCFVSCCCAQNFPTESTNSDNLSAEFSGSANSNQLFTMMQGIETCSLSGRGSGEQH